MGHTGPLGSGAKHKIAETAEPMTEEEKCSTWWHQTACGGGAMGDYYCYGAIVSYWMIGKSAVASMGMRINSITTLGDAEDNATILVRYPDCYAVLEGTWTTYNHTFKSPIIYGTKGTWVCVWHNLIGDTDMALLIVENADTSKSNSDFYTVSAEQLPLLEMEGK